MTAEKIEKFRFEIKQKVEKSRQKRLLLEGVGDARNAVTAMTKELILLEIIEIFNSYFPEKLNNFK